MKKIGILGAGAAGCMAAIAAAADNTQVIVIEKSQKPLSKVLISGGGRCNLSHALFSPAQLSKNYPRGANFLKKAFEVFGVSETLDFFEKLGVQTKTESDGRIFPLTNRSSTVVEALLSKMEQLGVILQLGQNVQGIYHNTKQFELKIKEKEPLFLDQLIIAIGGIQKKEQLHFLEALPHPIIPPIPSIFTFGIEDAKLWALSGLTLDKVFVKSEKLKIEGALLFTHWGISGPAVLALSAFAARLFAEKKYHFSVFLDVLPQLSQQQVFETLLEWKNQFPNKKIQNSPFDLPQRFWLFLLEKIQIDSDKNYQTLSKKGIYQLTEILKNQTLKVSSKGVFKEEFVSAGGIDLSVVGSLGDKTIRPMESKLLPNLFFAGEILDIDGITGGFNFQAAWTTGYLAGKSCIL